MDKILSMEMKAKMFWMKECISVDKIFSMEMESKDVLDERRRVR